MSPVSGSQKCSTKVIDMKNKSVISFLWLTLPLRVELTNRCIAPYPFISPLEYFPDIISIHLFLYDFEFAMSVEYSSGDILHFCHLKFYHLKFDVCFSVYKLSSVNLFTFVSQFDSWLFFVTARNIYHPKKFKI